MLFSLLLFPKSQSNSTNPIQEDVILSLSSSFGFSVISSGRTISDFFRNSLRRYNVIQIYISNPSLRVCKVLGVKLLWVYKASNT